MSQKLNIGQKFEDFSSFEIAIQQYQKAENVQFFRRSSRTIAKAQPRMPEKKLNECLKYYEIQFHCIWGCKNFKSRSTGTESRRRRRTRQSQRMPVIDLESSGSSCIDLTEENDYHFVDLTSSQVSLESDSSGLVGGNDSSVVVVGDNTDSPPEHRRRLIPPSPDRFDDPDLPPCPFPVDTARSTQSSSGASQLQSPDPVKITCPVCLDDDKAIKKSKRKIASTTCGHVFCTECIDSAVRSQHCCPVCRTKLTLRQFHTLHI